MKKELMPIANMKLNSAKQVSGIILLPLILMVAGCSTADKKSVPAPAVTTSADNKDAHKILLHWSFDENEGDICNDISGNGMAGKITGATRVPGLKGRALEWGRQDGKIVDGNMVLTPSSEKGLSLGDEWTVELSVFAKEYPNPKVEGGRDWCADFILLPAFNIGLRSNGIIHINLYLEGQDNNTITCLQPTDYKLPLNQWVNVAVSYSASNRELSIYIDGQYKGSTRLAGVRRKGLKETPLDYLRETATVRSYNGKNERFVGIIDEVLIANASRVSSGALAESILFHHLASSDTFLTRFNMIPEAWHGKKYRGKVLLVAEATGKVVREAEVPLNTGDSKEVSMDISGLAGRFVAKAFIMDPAGKEIARKEWPALFLYKDKPGVKIDAEGFLVKDGKRIFPIGACHVKPEDVGLIKEMGFNLASFFPVGDIKEFFKECNRQDVYVYQQFYGNPQEPIPSLDKTRSYVTNWWNNPCILFWDSADEPSPSTPGYTPYDLWLKYNTIKEADPYRRPVMVTLNMPNLAYAYAQACDIITCDPYPVGGENASKVSLTPVRDCIKHTVEGALNGKKGAFIYLQTFEAPPSVVFPTYEQLRAMAWSAAIFGARGFIYYNWDDSYSPTGFVMKKHSEYLAIVKRLNRELNDLMEVLLTAEAKDVKVEVEPADGKVDVSLRKVQNRLYILTSMLTAEKEQQYRIKLPPGCKGKEAKVINESRSVVIENGAIKDNFGPYAVHLYEIVK